MKCPTPATLKNRKEPYFYVLFAKIVGGKFIQMAEFIKKKAEKAAVAFSA